MSAQAQLFSIPMAFLGGPTDSRYFLLCIPDGSLAGSGVREDDWVFVQAVPVDLLDGQVAAIQHQGHAKARIVGVDVDRRVFKPTSPGYRVVKGHDCTVLGRVVAVLKEL